MAAGLEVVGPAARDRLLARPDVRLRNGRFELINERVGFHEAMTKDLLAVHQALELAGIEHLLIRRDDDRHTIAVDRVRFAEVEEALAAAFAAEPFYSRAAGEPAVLIAGGALARNRDPRVLRIFRPRSSKAGKLRFGATAGIRVEFWDFLPDEIVAPAQNALMRHRLPRAEAVEEVVERHGRKWTTLAGMFEPLIHDVDFEIDIVFSWVDGTDSEFLHARAQRMAAYVVGDGDDSEARYRQIDELKYALRSVATFAPWIRRIFIATDSPRPAWLGEHPKVTVVPSEEFFADSSVLPTHNSHAVEAQLHRIEGLSEHFLYSNDDMFFGRPVRPDMFFSPGGITKFIEATTRIGLGEPDTARSGFENAARVNRSLLRQRFGRVITRHLEHAPVPLRRSAMAELEAEFPEDFARTAASPFRSATDISVTNSLYHYYALMTGKAVQQTRARVRYIETTLADAPEQLDRLLGEQDYDFFCLNDGSQPELSVKRRTRTVQRFLESYFPISAPWEITPGSGSASSEALTRPAG